MIAEPRAAIVNLTAVAISDEFPFNLEPGRRRIWDLSLGKEIPLVGDDPGPEGEDEFAEEPRLILTAPGVSGGQLVTSLHLSPGQATGVCRAFGPTSRAFPRYRGSWGPPSPYRSVTGI